MSPAVILESLIQKTLWGEARRMGFEALWVIAAGDFWQKILWEIQTQLSRLIFHEDLTKLNNFFEKKSTVKKF